MCISLILFFSFSNTDYGKTITLFEKYIFKEIFLFTAYIRKYFWKNKNLNNKSYVLFSFKYFSRHSRCKNEWHEISNAHLSSRAFHDDLSCFDLQVQEGTGNRRENHRRVENPAVTTFHDSNRVLTTTYSSQKGFNSRLFKHFARLILPPFFFSLPIHSFFFLLSFSQDTLLFQDDNRPFHNPELLNRLRFSREHAKCDKLEGSKSLRSREK